MNSYGICMCASLIMFTNDISETVFTCLQQWTVLLSKHALTSCQLILKLHYFVKYRIRVKT